MTLTNHDVDDSTSSDDESDEPTPRRRSRTRKVLLGLLVCLVVIALVLVGGAFFLQNKLGGQIDHLSGTFDGLTDRPARATGEAGKAVNILVMGTDRRSDEQTTGSDAKAPDWLPGQQRSDALMVVHINGDRKGATVVSIPRDSWVTVPGYGENKINAAFSFAGPSLAVETVEQLTDLRIDHLAVVDWDGFAAMIDALGGVTVNVPKTVHDKARNITWTAGQHELEGKQALNYVGQRYGLPGGDFDRVARQQAVLRALMQKTLSGDTLSNPKKMLDLLNTTTKNLTVDSGWSVGDMRGLALSMRDVRSSDVAFTTAPVKGLGREGQQSVVYLNKAKGRELWGAIREDRGKSWIDENGGGLGNEVN